MKIRHFLRILLVFLFSLSLQCCKNSGQKFDSEKILSGLQDITDDVPGKTFIGNAAESLAGQPER